MNKSLRALILRNRKNRFYRQLSLFYHLLRPLIDVKLFLTAAKNYPGFIKDLLSYRGREKQNKLPWLEIQPKIHDRSLTTPVDHHYFYQQIWVFKKILNQNPSRHVDIGSSYEISGYLAQFLPVTFGDLRPVEIQIENLRIIKANLLELPFNDGSQESVSCLHVAEHIGLGRYGDKLDPNGTQKACFELTRILKPKGHLYLSTPIGRERVCFNAHRVFNPKTIKGYFDGLKLIEFSAVDDQGKFHKKVDYNDFTSLDYGCGMFEFEKRVDKTRRRPRLIIPLISL